MERTHPALSTNQMRPHHLGPFEVGDLILAPFVPAAPVLLFF